MTTERLAEIREWANKYGAANSWTGTTGTAAAMIRELLDYVEDLRDALDGFSLLEERNSIRH